VTPDPRPNSSLVTPTPAPVPVSPSAPGTPSLSPQPSNAEHADIFEAVKARDEQSVRLFIERDGKDILDKRDFIGFTPFLHAAQSGHVGVMSVMYESKPDVLQQTDNGRGNALHQALLLSKPGDVVAKLLEWAAEAGVSLLGIKNKKGKTPWDLAAERSDIREIMEKYKKQTVPSGQHISGQAPAPQINDTTRKGDKQSVMAAALRLRIDRQNIRFSEADRLGAGGFGTVYKGLWKGQPVAIKVVNEEDRKLIPIHVLYDDVLKEASALTKLTDP